MAKILVAYATVEGQTRKIAQFIADHLTRRRDEASLLDVTDAPADPGLADYDAVILASPVHVTRHAAAAVHFARTHAAALNRLPSAFVSVSLHAASPDAEDEEEVRAYVDAFCAETGWLPRAVCYAAGALRFTEYDFFKRLAARGIAKDRGISPSKDGDIELTDWRALTTFIDDFLRDQAPGA